jgi:membrane peptidoglycan carboxypeptidase
MTSVPRIARRRSFKRHLDQNNLSRGTALGCSLLVSLMLLLGGMAISLFFVTLTRDLPSLEIFSNYLDPPNGMLLQPTVLYDRTGENILLKLRNPVANDARYLLVNRSASGGEEYFSEEVVRATILNFEPDFWNTDYIPFTELLNEDDNLLAHRLVSEVILWDEPQGMLHDLRVRLLAAQVIEEFGKEKVLEWYLNSAKYGNFVYGADAAAQVYLGKSASELNLAEAFLIATIAETPDINPHTVPELTLERWKSLIQNMLDRELISTDEARRMFNETFIFRAQIDLPDDFKPFTNFVLEQLALILPRDRLERGGINIITTMDYDLQVQTQCAMYVYVTLYGSLPRDLSAIDGSPCKAARLLPTVHAEQDEFPESLRATTAISDPKTGQILAIVMVSNVDNDPAQIYGIPSGTVLTPFIYLTAFTRGFNPGTMVWDVPENIGISEKNTLDSNFDALIDYAEPYHGPIRLRTALANDYLRPALRLMDQIGLDNVISTLIRFGIFSQNLVNEQTDLEQLLFEEDISLIDVVRANGILANQGVIAGQVVENKIQAIDQQVIDLSGVIRLQDSSGNTLLDWSSPQSRSIVSPQLAYLISHVLSDETARWKTLGHPNPLEIGRSASVKLSRTFDGTESWVIGYDPERVVGVWVESLQDDRPSLLPQLSSGVWHAVIQYALSEKPAVTWQVPPGINTVEVCDPSGLLPTPNCPFVVSEIFLSGQEPGHFDTLYQSFQINRETGNLATVFTPPELIEERIYLVVPPQAEEWARSENLPIPPENYDAVGTQRNDSSNIRIDSPTMFSHVGGMVSIHGSAGGSGFSYYRIQVGKGLNPQEWIQIGEDIPESVEDDFLGIWDTNGLSGLYMIQLMVVYQDQRVEKAIHQVTIDNQAPELIIRSPDDEQWLSAGENEIFLLRADAVDDLVVAEVGFFIDDRMLTKLTLPPYVVPWEPKIGKHTLLVKVKDLAGNVSQDTVEFTVVK